MCGFREKIVDFDINRTGIYCIQNMINNKRYIGKTEDSFKERWKEHKRTLKNGSHFSEHLHNSWKKYGSENFIFQIVEYVNDLDILSEREGYWIEYYESWKRDKGYNLERFVEGRQIKSEETRKKISIANSGENHVFFGKKRPEHSKAMSGENNPMFGTVCFWRGKKRPEHAEKMRGIVVSEETRKKLSIANSGENNAMAKLTWAIVEEIREKFESGEYTQRELAKEYEAEPMTIHNIVKFKQWKIKKDE
jgi:group I intron endonuclease